MYAYTLFSFSLLKNINEISSSLNYPLLDVKWFILNFSNMQSLDMFLHNLFSEIKFNFNTNK